MPLRLPDPLERLRRLNTRTPHPREQWNSVPLTLIVELALFGGGLALYLRATRSRDRIGTWGLWAMVALLVVFFVGGTFGAPPPSERALAVTTLGLWLFVPWGWWVDRHREPIAVDRLAG